MCFFCHFCDSVLFSTSEVEQHLEKCHPEQEGQIEQFWSSCRHCKLKFLTMDHVEDHVCPMKLSSSKNSLEHVLKPVHFNCVFKRDNSEMVNIALSYRGSF
jgi:hypothetical protein